MKNSCSEHKQINKQISIYPVIDLFSPVGNIHLIFLSYAVSEQYIFGIQKWREEDKFYSETHSFTSIMQKVRDQQYVTFVGGPGSGKSATAYHIALKLQEEGYMIVPIKDLRKIEDCNEPRNPQVFVVDDVVGVTGLQKTKLDLLTDYEKKITHPNMIMSKTLMTCREAVFNETKPHSLFITKDTNVIDLHSSDHALDDKDKNQILQKHGLSGDMRSTSCMFPLLCKLFSKHNADPYGELSDIFLTWGEKEDITKYCRSPSHKKIKGEICHCLSPTQIEKFVERLGEEVFMHSAFEDESIKKLAFQKGILTHLR
jgi:hypothetical protein